MADVLDTLERRVSAAAELIAGLRDRVEHLEAGLAAPRPPAAPPNADAAAAAELERLRAERIVVRERIRVLLAEIDKVTW